MKNIKVAGSTKAGLKSLRKKRILIPKLEDVADAAGVSPATVSRALNRPGMVSDDTSKKIMAAVQSLGYRVNKTASNLRKMTSGSILILVPNIGNPFFSLIISGIESVMNQNQLDVVLVDSKQNTPEPDRITDYLHRNRNDGLIILDGLLPESVGEFLNRSEYLPAVFACELPEEGKFPSVVFDNAGGAKKAVGHLLEIGRKLIGHITGPAGNYLTAERLQGYKAALQKHSIEERRDWIFPGDFGMDCGVWAAKKWAVMNERPDAMFCANDMSALGFISEVVRLGFRVPEDVAVVGFDDIEIASRYLPSLTTIRQPSFDIGKNAAELLIEEMNEDQPRLNSEVIILQSELIKRQSTEI